MENNDNLKEVLKSEWIEKPSVDFSARVMNNIQVVNTKVAEPSLSVRPVPELKLSWIVAASVFILTVCFFVGGFDFSATQAFIDSAYSELDFSIPQVQVDLTFLNNSTLQFLSMSLLILVLLLFLERRLFQNTENSKLYY